MPTSECVRLGDAARLCGLSAVTILQLAKHDSLSLSESTEGGLGLERRDLRLLLLRRGLDVPQQLEQWPRVLIVDDEPQVRWIAEQLFKSLWPDSAICLSPDGDFAHDVLPEFRPHLLVLDLRMPGLGGDELCRQVRGDPALAHTRILVITGYDDPERRVQLLNQGVAGYIAKPFEPKELREMAVRLVGYREVLP